MNCDDMKWCIAKVQTSGQTPDRTMNENTSNRRDFIKAGSTAAVAASTIAFPTVTFGKPDSRKLKIGFIGCGGRGTGAANQALAADSNVELWAMGEVSEARLNGSLGNISKRKPGMVNVDKKRQFIGLDAYEKVLDSGVDLVILTTPPGFRPLHFKAAVEAGNTFSWRNPWPPMPPVCAQSWKATSLPKKRA